MSERTATFEKVIDNVQYWRYGPGLNESLHMMGLDKVKDAQVGDTRTFVYTVHGSVSLWRVKRED